MRHCPRWPLLSSLFLPLALLACPGESSLSVSQHDGFSQGLDLPNQDSAQIEFDAGVLDSALYCHGNRGLDNGTVANFTSTISSCDTCHPFMNSSSTSIKNLMSGEHKKHIVGEGAACYYCHDSVVDSSNAIKNPDLHVNGIVDISFNASAVGTGTWNGSGCSLNCHGESHRVGDSW